jgi:N6-adenosine-specific RNA methylase IME4
VGHRYRKDLGDIGALAQSIVNVGLLHPIVITRDGQLIAGQRRLAACKQLGWHEVPIHVVDLADVVRGEHDENRVRKDFLPSEAVAIAREVEPLIREAARKRQLAGQPSGNLPEGKGDTRDKTSAYVGMSGRTLEKAEAVVEAAEQEPEKYGPLVREMDKTGRVGGVHKKLRVLQQAQKIEQEPPPLPTGPFRVIAADPPWAYEKRAGDVSQRGGLPYPSMSPDEIKALRVGDIAADDCVLWLWTTNAHLPAAFEVVKAWGFEYKTLLTWVKDRMGTGDWLRGQSEHCLMCVRGRPVVVLTNQTTVLHAPSREHSRKPDEFYQLVESLCPGAKVELFAREQRSGWVAHGSECNLFS